MQKTAQKAIQSTARNKFFSRGESQPSFIQGLALGAFIIAALFATYLTLSNSQDETIPVAETPTESISQSPDPELEVNDLEPVVENKTPIEDTQVANRVLLSETQAIEKIPELSPSALIQNWISTEEYIRKTIALVENIAQDKFPKKDLAQFFLDEKFKVRKDGDKVVLDTTGYERFNKIAESIVSIDTALVIDIFQAMEPKIQTFYDELGNTDKSFRSTILEAIGNIQNVPVIHDPIILVRPNITYKFADPELESMSTLSKQFIRMGPVNTLLIQDKLNEIATLIDGLQPINRN